MTAAPAVPYVCARVCDTCLTKPRYRSWQCVRGPTLPVAAFRCYYDSRTRERAKARGRRPFDTVGGSGRGGGGGGGYGEGGEDLGKSVIGMMIERV